jgi:hypothetical protein
MVTDKIREIRITEDSRAGAIMARGTTMVRGAFSGVEVGGDVADMVGDVGILEMIMTIIGVDRMGRIRMGAGMRRRRKSQGQQDLCSDWTTCRRCRSKSYWIRQVKWALKIREGC